MNGMPRLRIVILLLFPIFSLCGEALASGGVIKRKTDGGADGYYYNALGTAAGRFGSLYGAGEFDVNAIICGVATADLDQSLITPGVDDYRLIPDLRSVDPNCTGYADLTVAGLILTADANSIVSCSTAGTVPNTATFGGGAGTADPLTAFVLTATQPANNDVNEGIDFCGVLLDTTSIFVNSARTQGVVAGGAKTTIGFNHFLEAVVFEPKEFDVNLRMTGSSRFAGDPGLPIVFTRRHCQLSSSNCVEDPTDPGFRGVPLRTKTNDFITARITVDNNSGAAPRALNLMIEGDRSVLNPKLTPKDVTNFFRPVGGGAGIMNPITFPNGRTVFNLEIKTAIKRKFLPLFPIDFPFTVFLQDPNITSDRPDGESQLLGLRPSAGYYDNDSHAGGFFFSQSPVLTGDAISVRFDSIDLPPLGATLDIRGSSVVGGEFGSSGLAGLDAFQIRVEDSVIQGSPDLSPQGLFRTVGTIADPGNGDGIQMGPPATTVLIDFTNIFLIPVNPALSPNLFGMAFLNPGDTLASLTAIGATSPGDTFIGNSSVTNAFRNPSGAFNQNDMEIRLDLNGELGNTIEIQRKTRILSSAYPRHAKSMVQVDREGVVTE